MNSGIARNLRRSAGYYPSVTKVEYEPAKLHHVARMPVYEKHTRIIRSWDPKLKKIVGREVEKIIMRSDGRIARSPIMAPILEDGVTKYIPQTELIPISAPVKLKAGSPKALYRLLKKQEHAAI